MSKQHLTDLDRLAVRQRPAGQAIMHQSWGKLLFMHWRIEEKVLRPLIPDQLEIDTFDGSAWIAIAPFTMWDIRAFPPFLPSVPGLSSMHELNVRTYVHFDRVPGVWFFSLDCNSAAAVLGARTFFFLPYYHSEIEVEEDEQTIDYSLERIDDPPAEFEATWKIGETLPYSHPGSLEFFLTERYCLYSEREGEIYRADIHHEPWPLQKATLTSLRSSMIESHGLPTPKGDPLIHYAEEVSVDIWPLESVM
ncbi:MAG: YqjF family protein [Pyrinomonadaceae bacterium]